MDYKNMYNEAKKRFKAFKEKYYTRNTCLGDAIYDKTGNMQKDFEAIFQEPNESEDERIRKALIDALKVSETIGELKFRLPEPTREECIAYLEKQKEQNGEDEECIDFTIYHPLKNGKGKYECIPYSFYGSLTSFSEGKDLIDFLRTCFYTKEECNEWIEKQKEQKPAEWSKDDKKLIDDVINSLCCYQNTLSDYQKEIVGEEIRKLKSLKPQPKQEWSEEDEKHINIILRVLDRQQCWDGATGKKCNPYQDEIDWLKSLRPVSKESLQPHWKPSEEQMDALKELIDDANRAGWVTPGATELYEQLKKLM